jgi:hypothetical protein
MLSNYWRNLHRTCSLNAHSIDFEEKLMKRTSTLYSRYRYFSRAKSIQKPFFYFLLLFCLTISTNLSNATAKDITFKYTTFGLSAATFLNVDTVVNSNSDQEEITTYNFYSLNFSFLKQGSYNLYAGLEFGQNDGLDNPISLRFGGDLLFNTIRDRMDLTIGGVCILGYWSQDLNDTAPENLEVRDAFNMGLGLNVGMRLYFMKYGKVQCHIRGGYYFDSGIDEWHYADSGDQIPEEYLTFNEVDLSGPYISFEVSYGFPKKITN